MCRAPLVLVSVKLLEEVERSLKYDLPSPLHSHHEKKHSADRQETSDVIDLTEHLSSSETLAVDARWREVETSGNDQSNESPDSAETTNPSPRGVISNQLTIEHRRAERDNREDQYSDVLATLARWCQLGSCGESSKFVDAGAHSSEHHTTDEDVHVVSG